MAASEIVFPETKPETEWVRGRALQKMSPTYRHGVTQMRVATALDGWARENDNGRVATEWRFRLTPPGERTRPLVPDVAYVSYDALPKSAADDVVAIPNLAPTIAVEILSPDDRADDVRDKIATYLAAGTIAVFVLDPKTKTAIVSDRLGERSFAVNDSVEHEAFAGLSLGLDLIFVP